MAGFKLKVYNRTREKLEPLLKLGAQAVNFPAETAEPGSMVITMLSDDAALRDVTLGSHGLCDSFGSGSLHLSMSTISPDTSRDLAQRHRQAGGDYIAATVSGRPDAAATGKLGIYVSGASEAKKRVADILRTLGRNVADCGEDPGAANVVKLAANFMLFSAVEAFAEALTFAEKQNLDRNAVMKALCDNLFDDVVYRNYGKLLAEQHYDDPQFKLKLAFKDLKLAIQCSESADAPMRLAESLHNRMLSLIATGRGDCDFSVIGRGAAEEAGLIHANN
ncbi:6-phosphogluconate dehydrogenase NAD-binding [Pedosphaera parvula Ellin514]|uniref:6-phosphogluconate dehydrogenase NAD-binding n=2 Tax=Pedosphaera TaxID=1032526 RepID=B9XQX0_PEDPL|nr:6-phosphogluconate dehydrogenase NAD-binding [Pedosphaera parvula Ellin514]